jgi:aryl-alcohol dehydrogenase-like predicted oxidoreductase
VGTMRQRLLGGSGLRVAELSLGTMTFAQEQWGTLDRGAAQAMFDAYVDAGGNFVDTADRYATGESERWVGDLVRSDRERFVVATKYGLDRLGHPGAGHPNAGGTHRKNLVHAVEGSLRRLNLEHIDLYWVHAWDPMTSTVEVMRALDDLVRSGKVLYVGVSDTPAWWVARANAIAEERGWTPFVAYQGRYSALDREAEREILPMVTALDMSFAAWGVLGSGLLSGKYATGTPDGRLSQQGAVDTRETTRQVVDTVGEVADEVGATPSQIAWRWAMDRPTVIPIIGARTLHQMKDNLAALDLHLTADQTARLDKAGAIKHGFPYDMIRRHDFMFGAAADVDPPRQPRR